MIGLTLILGIFNQEGEVAFCLNVIVLVLRWRQF